MEQYNYSEELDLKKMAKRAIKIVKNRIKIFSIILVGLILIATILLIFISLNPQYKSSILLKSKYIKIDQLEQLINIYNYNILDKATNPLDKKLEEDLIKSNVSKLSIIHLERDKDLNKEKQVGYELYNLSMIYSKKPELEDLKIYNTIIKDIQNKFMSDNEVIEQKVKLTNYVKELDTLLLVANKAGNSYKDKLVNQSSQMLIMDDLYAGLNELIVQKVNNQSELALLSSENILFSSSPIIVSKQIEYPWIIFIVAFAIWFSFCAIWTILVLIFSEND